MASKTQNKQRTEANTTPTFKFLVSSFRMKLEDQSIDYSWCRQRWRVSLLRKINESICLTIFLSVSKFLCPSTVHQSLRHSASLSAICLPVLDQTSVGRPISNTQPICQSVSPTDNCSQSASRSVRQKTKQLNGQATNLSVSLCFSQSISQSVNPSVGQLSD